MKNTNLKYLFRAIFTDGSVFKQTPDDKSKIDPEKRSEFYDLMKEVEKGKIIRMFILTNQNEKNEIAVDLGTGLFHVNGLPLLVEGDKLPTLPNKFELIYYRQHTQSVNVDYKKTKEGIMKMVGQTPTGDNFCEYFIGWQCTIAGKNYQQKIGVS